LAHPLELLQQDNIFALLPSETRSALNGLEIHDIINSTNEYLMLQAADGGSSGQVCLAERQTAGRGRRGRDWISPYGSNIYLSVLWRFSLAPIELSGLSLAAGLATVRALNRLGVTEVGLKWPNDVLWQEQKLAGLLLEVTGESGGPSQVVLGLGLNTHMSNQQGESIDQPWVDLTRIPGGKKVRRNQLAAELIHQLVKALQQFESVGLPPLLEEWQQKDLYHNKMIALQMGNRTIVGKHVGIDKNGALLLLHAGETNAHYAGEVSLRLDQGDDHANAIG
jgi:BirA family biotin operon repressor/biotin-[acetyl-CoA-carboxylase] ligase